MLPFTLYLGGLLQAGGRPQTCGCARLSGNYVRRVYLFTVTVLHNLFFIGNLSQFLLIQYRVENGKYTHMDLYSTNHRRVAPTWGVAFPWGPLYTIH